MKVLVIGGLGFVGSAICQYCKDLNDIDLVVMDNQSKGSLKNIDGVNCEFIQVDITESKATQDVINSTKPDIVLHLAAMHFIPDCNRDPVSCLHTNIIGTENVLLACKQAASVKKVIVTSSQAIYPIKDSPNNEEDLPQPCDVYGESKLANEFQALRFNRDTNINTIVVRLANVYGPRETNPHVIPEIMNQLAAGKYRISLGNIEPKRDFIFTSDVARAFITLSLATNLPGFTIFNLGSGKEYSIKEIIAKLSNVVENEITYEKDLSRYRTTERMHLIADISKIRNLTSWYPQVSIDQGLRDLCLWYKI